MRKGIILRVLQGTVLSPELAHALAELLPNYTLEYFEEKPDYRQSIANRINSLYESFLLILEAYPLNPKFTVITADTLRDYATDCLVQCTLSPKASLEELHKELERLTARLIEPLSVCWAWGEKDPVKEAVACLNEAEQSLLRLKGRADTATLTKNGEAEYVLQYDRVLPAYYDQLLIELRTIKACNYPKTPAFFRGLQEHEQAFFCHLAGNSSLESKALLQQLNDFLLNWEKIKKQYSGLDKQLTAISTSTSPLPEWYNKLTPSCKAMLLVLSKYSSTEITTKLNAFKQKIISSGAELSKLEFIPKIPQWYWALSGRKQYFLQHVIKSASSLEDVFAFVSSRDRDLPMPSNYCAHQLYLINDKAEAKAVSGVRYRSSHIANRDALSYPLAVQQRHCSANFAKVTEFATEAQPILLQTLISPIPARDYMPDAFMHMLPEVPPDYDLYKMAKMTVASSAYAQNTLQHNHPYNLAKYIYYTTATNTDSNQLIKTAQAYVDKIPELQELIDDYTNVLESPLGSATFFDYDGRELFLSSLEQLIILTIGGHSYGSCVSGKDRKAVELIHTDAMLLYRERYNKWPKFGDPKEQNERVLFIEIIVELYLSRHQHELAGQNAPGSEGIKTPYWYWPKDICEAINKRLESSKGLEYDDRLATDNEVKNICKTKILKTLMAEPNRLLSHLVAKQLGEKVCTQLYETLTKFINEKRKFQSVNTWVSSLPAGIVEIQALMRDDASGNNNVQRIAKIFCIVLERPDDDVSRTMQTRSVYDGIRRICQPEELKDAGKMRMPLDKIVEQVENEWQTFFKESTDELKSAAKIY